MIEALLETVPSECDSSVTHCNTPADDSTRKIDAGKTAVLCYFHG